MLLMVGLRFVNCCLIVVHSCFYCRERELVVGITPTAVSHTNKKKHSIKHVIWLKYYGELNFMILYVQLGACLLDDFLLVFHYTWCKTLHFMIFLTFLLFSTFSWKSLYTCCKLAEHQSWVQDVIVITIH